MRSPTTALAVALAVLTGCDSTLPWSSGSSAPGGGPGGPGDPSGSISVSPLSLAFTAQAGDATPAPKSATVAVTGPVHLAVQHSGAPVASAALVQTSATTYDVVVTPVAPAVAGALSGTVTVRGCTDASCTTQVQGSPATILVSYDVAVASSLAVTPASLVFDHVAGAASPAGQTLSVSDPAATGGYGTSVAYPGASGWLSVAPASGPLPATVTASVDPAALAPGSYPATISVTTSSGSRSVAVTLTVRAPALQAPVSVSFSAVSGQATLPAARALALTTDAGAPVAFTTSVTYGAGATGWLSVPAGGTAPTDLSAAVTTAELAPGSYTATIRITPTNGSPARDVAVTYDVAAPSLSVTPGAAAFTVTAATTPADVSRVLALSDAGTALAYAASTTAAWLSAAPGAGATSTEPALTVSLVPAELALLADGAYAAEVILSYAEPAGANVELRVPVTLDLTLPRATYVAPRVAVSGTTAEVVVRGTGLLAATSVTFGGSSASAVTPVSATELRATHPTLAAGAHAVRVSNNLGLDLGGPSLEVVDVVARTGSTASAGAKRALVFDDARGVAWVAGAGQVERYREANGWVQEAIPLANLRGLALSPDGTKVVAVAGAGVWELDAASAALALPAFSSATLPGFGASTAGWQLAFANDGTGVLVADDGNIFTCLRYDFATKAAAQFAGCYYYKGGIGASGDGARLVMNGGGTSPPQPIGHYDASAGAYVRGTVDGGYNHVAVDRTASRIVLVWDSFPNAVAASVLDASYATLGRLVSTTVRAVPSHDGTRAYTWDASGKVRVFDLTAAPVSGVFTTELGTAGGTAPVASPGAGVHLALSADGATLFLVGDQAFVRFAL